MDIYQNIICSVILVIITAITLYCSSRVDKKLNDKWDAIRSELRKFHQMAKEENTIEGLENIRIDLNIYCDNMGEQTWRQQVIYYINGKIDTIKDQEKKANKAKKEIKDV
jgi:hypothetical protein